jgi:crossover junction endodeoxyribonuclease RuvC
VVLGIDIGAHGAIALLDYRGQLIDVVDMPGMETGPRGRVEVNPVLLVSTIKRLDPACAYIETVASRPGSKASAMFAFGRSRGLCEGVLAALGISTSWITPVIWKKVVGLPALATKDDSRGVACARWPGHAALFARKTDHDKAEAALIGLAGILRSRAREGVAVSVDDSIVSRVWPRW